MTRGVVLVAALLVGAASPSPKAGEPIVRIGNAKSLVSVIRFGPGDPRLAPLGPGEILWRINVDAPRNAPFDRAELFGYAPVNLHFRNGRCFQVQMDNGGKELRSAPVNEDCTSQAPYRPLPEPLRRPGMTYVGKTWDLSAWKDEASGKTMLYLDRDPERPPLLTTSMRVLGVGGIGSPDTPMTEVTLVGYVGKQLTLATVMLYYR